MMILKTSQAAVWLPSAEGWFHRYSALYVRTVPSFSTTTPPTYSYNVTPRREDEKLIQ